jgi:hypothetical protein
MTILFYWRCESDTLDGTDDESAGDTTAATTNDATYNTSAGLVSGNGILANAVGADARKTFNSASLINPGEGAAGMWLRYVDAQPAAGSSCFVARDSANDNAVRINSGDAGEMRLQTESATVTTNFQSSGANIAPDEKFFVLIRWDQPGSRRRIEIYDDTGTLVSVTQDHSTAFDLPGSISSTTGLRLGVMDTITQVLHIDNVFISDTYEEPIHNNLLITSWTQYDGTPDDLPELSSGPPGLIKSIVRHVGN